MKVILKLCPFLLNDHDFLKVGLKEQNNMLDGSKRKMLQFYYVMASLMNRQIFRHKEANRHIQLK